MSYLQGIYNHLLRSIKEAKSPSDMLNTFLDYPQHKKGIHTACTKDSL